MTWSLRHDDETVTMHPASLSAPLFAAALSFTLGSCQNSVPYTRLSKNDSALLIVDLQTGLAAAVRDWEPTLYRNNILAHAGIGLIYDLPVVMTTSVETGPNGPLPKEILQMYPNAPLIRRPGEVNSWDNAEFRAAVEATGKKQMIIAGITTDVCESKLHTQAMPDPHLRLPRL